MNLLLDTDVFIYFFRGDRKVQNFLRSNDQFYYSYITKKELLQKKGLSHKEREAIFTLLNRIRQITVDEKIASLAERLVKKHHDSGLRTADALIAATALIKNLILVTFNQKHYRMIEGLALFPLEKLNNP